MSEYTEGQQRSIDAANEIFDRARAHYDEALSDKQRIFSHIAQDAFTLKVGEAAYDSNDGSFIGYVLDLHSRDNEYDSRPDPEANISHKEDRGCFSCRGPSTIISAYDAKKLIDERANDENT